MYCNPATWVLQHEDRQCDLGHQQLNISSRGIHLLPPGGEIKYKTHWLFNFHNIPVFYVVVILKNRQLCKSDCVSPPGFFVSAGGHYCWQLWARWTHQESQRDRYWWVFFFCPSQIHPACFPESPPGYISNPFAVWSLEMTSRCNPLGWITREFVYSMTIPQRLDQEKWSVCQSGGVDWPVCFCQNEFNLVTG